MLFPLNILHGTLWDAVDTHRPTQRCMIYQLNKGNNGKSSFLNILHKIMGEYYTAVDKSVFIKIRNNNRQANAHTSHLIPIIGKRAIASSEVTKGKKVYINEIDSIGRYKEKKIEETNNDGDEVKAIDLYEDYMCWCRENIIIPEGNTTFGKRIKYNKKRKREGLYYIGIK